MRATLLVIIAASVLVGCSQNGKVLGKAPKGTAASVLAVRAGDTPSSVVLQGTITEKCPAAGCWFRLQDSTGEIKVDTKTAGFVVTKIPVGTSVTVAGKIAHVGGETLIDASGLRY